MKELLQEGETERNFCKTGKRERMFARRRNSKGFWQERKTGRIFCKKRKREWVFARKANKE